MGRTDIPTPNTHTHTHSHTHTHTLTFTQYLNLWAKIARCIFLYKRSHDALASKTFLLQNLCLARNICTDVSVSLQGSFYKKLIHVIVMQKCNWLKPIFSLKNASLTKRMFNHYSIYLNLYFKRNDHNYF